MIKCIHNATVTKLLFIAKLSRPLNDSDTVAIQVSSH